MTTGAGKTEIMSSSIRLLLESNPTAKILVIEPTDVLVTNTVARFRKYNIDARPYKEVRHDVVSGKIPCSVIVAHPKGLLNDIERNMNLLHEVKVAFWDECQHLKSDTWSSLNESISNVEYSIGLSALVIDKDHLTCTSLNILSLDEALILGATGKVLVYVPAKYYIDRNILATPVILQVNSDVRTVTRTENNWSVLRRDFIESTHRSYKAAQITDVFIRHNRRVLILVGTKYQAVLIARYLAEKFKHASNVAISFGGDDGKVIDATKFDKLYSPGIGVNEDVFGQTTLRLKLSEDVFDSCFEGVSGIVQEFDDKKYNILIGTSHLDEGVDVKELDAVILASGGKKDRRVIQRIGRCLRKSKSGKYAYVVDFNDEGNGVLSNHSRLRMNLFEDTIEVPEHLIYKQLSIESVEPIFTKLEGIVMNE